MLPERAARLGESGSARSVNTSSSSIGVPSGLVSGTRQFGYSSTVPGWFWVRTSPTASGNASANRRDGVRPRYSWSARTISSVLALRSVVQQADPDGVRPARPPARPLSEAVPRSAGPGEQVELLAQPDVLPGQITRGGRQVVRGDRGQAVLPPPLGAQRPAVTVAVQLEPQDRGTEQAALAQVVAHPRLDGAQVFTDHDRPGPVRLKRDDADHRLVVVAHVGAVGRRRALRDPPQPEQPDDVVDANAARVPQHGVDHARNGA